ncbi:TniB family NTP-binding protein [Pseudoalteromonas shioyasakiensis]|uniref:TniB family NTP-binding protein n=1 Tax=Pseudoalteromonas shioyasakiensis TaxID=1190813 RepID=UPI0007848E9D|nr:TniB family NTP-binding protein [Pseudoalteromonas shioyasakiensis]
MSCLKGKAELLYSKTFDCANNRLELADLLEESQQTLSLGVGSCSVIVGDSGSGKTTLVKAFIKRFNEKHSTDVSENKSIKACYIRSPSNMSPLDLYRAILGSMAEPGSIQGSEVELRRRIAQQVKNKRYRVLVFDEFQQVVEKVGVKSARQIADYLKELVDELGLFLVFAGTSKVMNILEINEQFASRCSLIIEKKLLSVSTRKNYVHFVKYLITLNEHLKFSQIDFTNPEISLPIFAMTKGDLRQLSMLIRKAVFHACDKNRDEVLVKDFAAVFSSISASKKNQANPFSKKFSLLKVELGVNYEL